MGNGCWQVGRTRPQRKKKERDPEQKKEDTKEGKARGGMDEMGMGMLKWISRHDNFAGAGKLRCTIP